MSTENKKNQLIPGHDYDGIRELDNPTPSWWQAAFAVTILFGVGYFGYFQLLDGPTPQEELRTDLAAIEKLQQSASGSVEADKLTAMVKDPAVLAKGREVFQGRCIVCHGDKGQGVIGPNLTDNYWLHGNGTAPAILQVVRNGVPEKGMPPWGTMLKPEEVTQVAVYVRSIRGTNPPGGKAPQGTEYHD